MDNGMIAAVLAMRKWCEVVKKNIGKVHDIAHEKGESCANVTYLAYSVNEIERISSDMETSVMQFLNVMKVLSVAGEALCEQLGDDFTDVIPMPPIRIEEVVQVVHTQQPPQPDKSHLN